MPDQIRNEHIKLFANWTNTVATAMLAVGVFTPLAIKFYGIGEPAKKGDLLVYLPWVCICAAVALHLGGQLILELMDDDDDE
jgi:hypothetical protein